MNEAGTTLPSHSFDSSLVKRRKTELLWLMEKAAHPPSTPQLQTPLSLENGGAISHYCGRCDAVDCRSRSEHSGLCLWPW